MYSPNQVFIIKNLILRAPAPRTAPPGLDGSRPSTPERSTINGSLSLQLAGGVPLLSGTRDFWVAFSERMSRVHCVRDLGLGMGVMGGGVGGVGGGFSNFGTARDSGRARTFPLSS